MMNFFKRLTEIFLLIFVFILPWQTKLVLRPAVNNFNDISLYVSHLVLLLALICFFIYKIWTKDSGRKTPVIWYFLGILEIVMVVSFFYAPDRLLATFHYLLFLGGLGLFYLVREGINRAAYEDGCLNRIRIIYVFLASTFLQASLGIYQFLSQKSFAFKYLGIASHNPEVAGTAVIETVSGRWLRAYGGLDHPNVLGGVLAIALILSAYLLARKKIINSNIQIWGLIMLFFSYFFALIALFFSFSRAAWLAYAVGMLILMVVIFKREDRWVAKRFFALLFFSLALLMVAALPYHELAVTRFYAEGRLEQISISEREEYTLQAGQIIKNHPWFGVGNANYVKYLELNSQVDNFIYYQPVHNVFLLVFAENGIFAFLSVTLFLVFLAFSRRRQNFAFSIIAAMVIMMMIDHWLISLPFGILFFFLVLGLI
ncbi:MAG TPA: O-antigen ligase family protein [Candidatus Saccharimonadales bacterium]|nr:O-antigen ligase family protein [Candidatus Saccharimonadales bacterium]